jgi:hypothetical protein
MTRLTVFRSSPTMLALNLNGISRGVFAAILCAVWAGANFGDALAQTPKLQKYQEVDMGIDHYDAATGIRRVLSFVGSNYTTAANPADFSWEVSDAATGSDLIIWGYIAGPVTFSNKPLESATWTAPLYVYLPNGTPLLGTLHLQFTGTGKSFADGSYQARNATVAGTIFVDMNGNGTVDAGELLDLSNYWARLRDRN